MKKFKHLFILFVVMFLTGCSVNYKLTINDDLSIDEEVVATEYTKIMEKKTNLKGEDSINYLYEMFRKNLDNETFYYDNSNNLTIGTATESYKDFNDFNFSFKSDLFYPLKYKKDKNIITLSLPQTKQLGNHYSDNLIYDEVSITMVIPFKVLENNADKVNGNKYTWNIEKDKKLRTIKIKFDTSRSKNGFLINTNNKKVKVNYSYIVSGIIVFIICILIIMVTINNKKNNRF